MKLSVAQIFSFLAIVLQGSFLCESKTHQLKFESPSNFGNPAKWSDGRLPCSGDKIAFDDNLVVSVFVQTNATITEIVLPMSGELIFDSGIMWGPSNELSGCSSTPGHTATFDSTPADWFNMDNWRVYDQGSDFSLDVLDTEKVPCDYDDIQFPSWNSWTVFMPFDSKLSSLSIWGKSYTTSEFTTYRETGSGRYQFQGVGSLTSIGGRCNDVTGCVCRSASNAQTIDLAICNHVSCPDPICQEPFRIQGQCCSICGALLVMAYSSTYREDKVIQQIDDLKGSNSKYTNVHYALSKIKPYSNTKTLLQTGNDYIQILLRDEESGTQHGLVAQEFSKKLYNILTTNEDLGVSNVTSTESGKGVASSGSLSSGAIVGIVIGVICAIVLLAVVAMNSQKRCNFRNIGFSHSKLKEEQENFDNPLYDMGYKGVESVEKSHEKQPVGESSSITGIPQPSVFTSDFGISFDNPLYQDEDV